MFTIALKTTAGIVVGIVLSFLIQDPVVGGVAAFFCAAWRSWLAGIWLFQHDVNRRRAWVCFAFYVANAFWLGAFLALPTVFISINLAQWIGVNVVFDRFKVAVVSWALGVIAATLVGSIGVATAFRFGLKIWVNPNIRDFSDEEFENLSNPAWHRIPGFNFAIFVVATSVALPPILLICFGFLSNVNLLAPPFGFVDNVLLPLVLLIVFPATLVFLYMFFASRIIADAPTDCWQD